MSRCSSILAMVLVACGSGAPATESGSYRPPDALKAACVNAQQPAAPNLCFAGVDYSTLGPGSIFEVAPDGTVSKLFQRVQDSLTSYAQAPDGTTYFTNAVNGTALYKTDGLSEAIVYQHSTYVRMVRVDSKGQIYFNEDSGAAANGKIYKLFNGKAELFYEVDLSTVDGFWGDFGFDGQDRLWLSSSNSIPSTLYLVNGSGPQRVYVSEGSGFMGFRFIGETQVLFAGQDQMLRVLDLCSGKVSEVFTVPGKLQAQDVNECPIF
jgi:hypothetical protein